MSGDVQPRKRKDKKKKRDSLDRRSEGDIFARKLSLKDDEEVKESHHGVHETKMGAEDVHLHVQSDHDTGGHWCAKVFFFALLAVLLGLVGLIILENRGLSDLDTPLSESRYSTYFDGWVDEHRESHDDHGHDKVLAELEDHDHDAEPFDEEEDHSEQEVDEHDDHDDHDDHDEEEEHEDVHDEENDDNKDDDQEEEQVTEEEDDDNEEHAHQSEQDDDDDNNSKENENDDDDDDDEPVVEADDDDDEVSEEPVISRNKREVESEKESNDGDDDEGFEDDNAINDDDDNDDDGNDSNENDNVFEKAPTQQKASPAPVPKGEHDPFDESETNTTNKEKKIVSDNKIEITPSVLEKQVDELYEVYNKVAKALNKPVIEENKTLKNDDIKEDVSKSQKKEDDDADASIEEVYENDAGEQLLLQQKAKEEHEKEEPQEDEEEGESSSLALKIFVGVALAFVARNVLIRKNRSDKTGDDDAPDGEPISVRRRFTMISMEDSIPLEDDIIDDEYLEEEEYSEEGDEGEKYSDEDDDDQIAQTKGKFNYETFEELNNMYQPKGFQANLESAGEQENIRFTEIKDIKPKAASVLGIKFDKKDDIRLTEIEDIKPKAASVLGIKYEDNTPKPQSSPQSHVIAPQKISPPIVIPDKVLLPSKESKPFESMQPVSSASGSIPRQPIQTSIPPQSQPDVVKQRMVQPHFSSYDRDVDRDEEIYDDEEDEDLEEEEEPEDDEDISDVDDDELMRRLDAKYGRLPDKQYNSSEEEEDLEDGSWTKIKPKSGGPQSTPFDEDSYINDELRRANEDMLQNNLNSALKTYESLAILFPDSPGALYGKAKVLDRLAEKYSSNQMLSEAIDTYKRFLALDENIDDDLFKNGAERCIDRMRFRGMHNQAVKIHEKLIERFEDDPHYRNELAVTYLLLNRLSDAKQLLHKTLTKWREDGYAQVLYGFILKNLDNDLQGAVMFMKDGIKTGANGTQDGRFYFNLGDALQRLGRAEEAKEIYLEGANKGLFLSEHQRSLYNINGLKAQPFWTIDETSYTSYFELLLRSWELIRKEGLAALNADGYFIDEAENLKDSGEWKQLELFARGVRNTKNCKKARLTCQIIDTFPAAKRCKRGQIKFSVMHPGTHVWPHCGPTNCRLRAHLGLKVPPGTSIRVAEEKRSWKEGEFLIFDDSFEHEVWHNGTGVRLVLIIDVWHPELTEQQRDTLSPI